MSLPESCTTTAALVVERAAHDASIGAMQSLRDKATLASHIADALGGRELEQLLTSPPDELDGAVVHALRYLRHYIKQEVQQYVDTQYRLMVDASGKRAILDGARGPTQIPTNTASCVV
jgi:hypothetical protein